MTKYMFRSLVLDAFIRPFGNPDVLSSKSREICGCLLRYKVQFSGWLSLACYLRQIGKYFNLERHLGRRQKHLSALPYLGSFATSRRVGWLVDSALSLDESKSVFSSSISLLPSTFLPCLTNRTFTAALWGNVCNGWQAQTTKLLV